MASVLTAIGVLAGAGGCSARSDTAADAPAAASSPSPPASAKSTPTPTPTPESTAASPSPSRPKPGAALPPFSSSVRPVVRGLVPFSHRRGCPVELGDLRYLRMSFVAFDGSPAVGEMIVHRDQADPVLGVFKRLYAARWPLARMRLVDDYRGEDALSMAANNTSGYNCRRVAGTDSWSDHAYGRAIDINPVQNPYVIGFSVEPAAGRRYAAIDRTAGARVARGVVRSDDVVISAFERIGWEWGGDWVNSKDYQHFSFPGR